MIVMFDGNNREVRLGHKIGQGAEGAVFECSSNPALLAKIYSTPVTLTQQNKLAFMIRGAAPALLSISAWPVDIVRRAPQGTACGILMPAIANSHPIFNLYNPSVRRNTFPDANWRFLIRTARNIAIALSVVHQHNSIVGDVSPGNLLVSPQAVVKFIDCDSFQVSDRHTTYRNRVGTLLFTPPELQTSDFKNIDRTRNHDYFGLAVLIFHLLFMGRHPYAGRFSGPGEMPIEKAISENRFAFGKFGPQRLMTPPPSSLPLASLPDNLASLFERAFSPPSSNNDRPSTIEWERELACFESSIQECRSDKAHHYSHHLKACPWCFIERSGGPSFFVNQEMAVKLLQSFNDEGFWHRLNAVPKPIFMGPLQPPQAVQGLKPTPLPPIADFLRLMPRSNVPTLPRFTPETLPVLAPFVATIVPDDPVFVPEPIPDIPKHITAALEMGFEAFEKTYLNGISRRPTAEHRILQALTFICFTATALGLYHIAIAFVAPFFGIVFGIGIIASSAQQQSLYSQKIKAAKKYAKAGWKSIQAEADTVFATRESITTRNRIAYDKHLRLIDDLAKARIDAPRINAERLKVWSEHRDTIEARRFAVTARNEAQRQEWSHMFESTQQQKLAAENHNAKIDAALSHFHAEIKKRQMDRDQLNARISQINEEWLASRSKLQDRFDQQWINVLAIRDQFNRLQKEFDTERNELEQNQRKMQFDDWLESNLLSRATISSIGSGRKATLASYGIENAADVKAQEILSIPGFGPSLCDTLLDWRRSVEARFRFDSSRSSKSRIASTLYARFEPQRRTILDRMSSSFENLSSIATEAEAVKSRLLRDLAILSTRLAQAECDLAYVRAIKTD